MVDVSRRFLKRSTLGIIIMLPILNKQKSYRKDEFSPSYMSTIELKVSEQTNELQMRTKVIEDLKMSLELLIRKYNELKEKYDSLKNNSKQGLNQVLKEKEMAEKETDAKLIELLKVKAKLEEQVVQMDSFNENVKNENGKLARDIAVMREHIKNMELRMMKMKEPDVSKAEVDKLESIIEKLRYELTLAFKLKEEDNTKNKMIINNLIDEKNNKIRQNTDLSKIISTKDIELKSKEREINEINQLIVNLKELTEKQKAELEQLRVENTKLTDSLRNIKDNGNSAEKEVSELRLIIEGKQKEIKELMQEIDKMKVSSAADKTNLVTKHKLELKELSERLTAKENEINAKISEKLKVTDDVKVEQLERDNKNLIALIARKEKELKSTKENKIDTVGLKKSLKSMFLSSFKATVFGSISAKIEEMETKVKSITEKIPKIRSTTIKRRSTQNLKWVNQLSEQQKTVENLQDELKNKDKLIVELQRKRENMNEAIVYHQVARDKAEKMCEELNAAWKSKEAAIESKFSEELMELRKKVSRLEMKVNW